MGIWVGRYAMVAGEVREHGPWLVERLRMRDEESVRLLVLAEPVDDRSAEFCHEVADAVAELFERETLSMTGGLLRALQQAHANLAEWNRRSLREHQVAVGITGVAVRDGEATIAQVGPGVVYVGGRNGVERLSTAGEPAARPLGGREPIEPQFRSLPVDEHGLLLLTSSVEGTLTPTAIGQTLSRGPERALAELFVQTRESRDLAAVLIAEVAAADDTPVAPVLTAESAPPREPAGTASVDSGAAGSETRPLFGSLSFPSLRRPRIAGRDSDGAGAELPWRVIALVAAVVIAVAVVGRFALPQLLEEDRGARLEQAIAAAELHLGAAAATADAGERRDELDAALVEVARARSIAPGDGDVTALAMRAEAALGALDAVIEVDTLRTVLEFQGTLTAPVMPSALGAGGGLLWLLEGERGRVFAIDPAGTGGAVEVYRSGESYGGAVARSPIALAWDGASERMLLLDAGRSLFAIPLSAPAAGAAGAPEVLPLRDVEEIDSLQAIATYAGNLYLLDADGGEIWRYLPAGDGFDSERNGLVGGGEDLEGASALVVDGDLLVLQGGRVRHFRLGEELAPLMRGVDQPPQSPAGIAADAVRDRVYVADRGGRRILVSDRDGEFIAQFHHPRFFDLRGLALSADGAELFVLTGDGVFGFDPLP